MRTVQTAGTGPARPPATLAAVAGTARYTDMVARYGGEELAVVLPGADLDCAHRTAERIRAAVAALEAPHPGSPTGFLTVSAGVATSAPRRGTRPDGLLKQADRCLYEAKNGGRNRVAAAG